LDSTAKAAAVALLQDRKLLAKEMHDDGNTHSSTILPMVERLLQENNLTVADVDLFCASAGPGSFTGVRIGAATVKGLAFGKNRPCVPVSALHALAYNLRDTDGIVCALMDARRGQFYTALFRVENGKIVSASSPSITAQCLRVPVSDGHTAAVFVSFEKKPSEDEIKEIWKNFRGRAQELELPSAPKQFLQYFEEPDRPQAKLDRDLEGGMAVTLGRLRPDTQYDYKFVGLSHNTLRGAAGGAVLLAELLCAEGYILPR
jgi:tRNA threonylcarbamoyl adenosine modification protein YeaZ